MKMSDYIAFMKHITCIRTSLYGCLSQEDLRKISKLTDEILETYLDIKESAMSPLLNEFFRLTLEFNNLYRVDNTNTERIYASIVRNFLTIDKKDRWT